MRSAQLACDYGVQCVTTGEEIAVWNSSDSMRSILQAFGVLVVESRASSGLCGRAQCYCMARRMWNTAACAGQEGACITLQGRKEYVVDQRRIRSQNFYALI